MIVVAGEALVDLVVPADGPIEATPGGAPYNVARGCARLGAPTALLASVSTDRFGRQLAAELVSSGVSNELLQRTQRPTTLAVAELDAAGSATYRFYADGTSAPALAPVALPPSTDVLVTGGLALVLEPMATAIEAIALGAAERVLVLVDVNCRPTAITDPAAHAARLRRVLARPGGAGAVVVKASDEDLAALRPGVPVRDAAEELLDCGAAAVLITAGAGPTTVVTAAGALSVTVAPVAVVDTIGAGDAFTAAIATWWRERGDGRAVLEDPTALVAGVEAAHAAAAVVVGRRGADPPRRADVAAAWP